MNEKNITKLNINTKIQNLWKLKTSQELIIAIEELSELIKELTKHLRGKNNRQQIIEELTDVLIMTQAIQLIFDIKNEEIERIKDIKERRTLDILK